MRLLLLLETKDYKDIKSVAFSIQLSQDEETRKRQLSNSSNRFANLIYLGKGREMKGNEGKGNSFSIGPDHAQIRITILVQYKD